MKRVLPISNGSSPDRRLRTEGQSLEVQHGHRRHHSRRHRHKEGKHEKREPSSSPRGDEAGRKKKHHKHRHHHKRRDGDKVPRDQRDQLSVNTDLADTPSSDISPTKFLIRACKDKEGWVVVGNESAVAVSENGDVPVNGSEAGEPPIAVVDSPDAVDTGVNDHGDVKEKKTPAKPLARDVLSPGSPVQDEPTSGRLLLEPKTPSKNETHLTVEPSTPVQDERSVPSFPVPLQDSKVDASNPGDVAELDTTKTENDSFADPGTPTMDEPAYDSGFSTSESTEPIPVPAAAVQHNDTSGENVEIQTLRNDTTEIDGGVEAASSRNDSEDGVLQQPELLPNSAVGSEGFSGEEPMETSSVDVAREEAPMEEESREDTTAQTNTSCPLVEEMAEKVEDQSKPPTELTEECKTSVDEPDDIGTEKPSEVSEKSVTPQPVSDEAPTDEKQGDAKDVSSAAEGEVRTSAAVEAKAAPEGGPPNEAVTEPETRHTPVVSSDAKQEADNSSQISEKAAEQLLTDSSERRSQNTETSRNEVAQEDPEAKPLDSKAAEVKERESGDPAADQPDMTTNTPEEANGANRVNETVSSDKPSDTGSKDNGSDQTSNLFPKTETTKKPSEPEEAKESADVNKTNIEKEGEKQPVKGADKEAPKKTAESAEKSSSSEKVSSSSKSISSSSSQHKSSSSTPQKHSKSSSGQFSCNFNVRGKASFCRGVCTVLYEALSNQSENNYCHVHDQPGRSRVVDLRQLISFTFSVQTSQLASLVIMTVLTLVGYCLIVTRSVGEKAKLFGCRSGQ